MARISVVIPTFNEKENITKLLIRLNEILPSLSFIVVDDNSPDGTEESLKKLNLKNLELIIRKNEKGLGSAIKLD